MNKEKILMSFDDDSKSYICDEKLVCKREFETLSPNGNKFNGKWVLRDSEGTLIDFDTYRNDVFERNDIIVDDNNVIY